MNTRKLFALILALLMMLGTAACSSNQSAARTTAAATTAAATTAATTTAATTTAATTAPSAFPVTVTDHAGREVTLTEKPEKLVSGYYISTSLVIGLGLEDQLIGIEAKAKSRPIYSLAAPQLLDLPNVGTAKEFNLEGCIALEPDLVILPLKLKDAADQLAKFDIPAICVNPESDVLLAEAVEMIAALTDTEAAAAALLGYGQAALDELSDALADAEAPTVYLAGNSSYLSTAGAKMYQNTLITAAGAVNAAESIEDSYWAEIDYEQLITWNPDYIIVSPGADYTVEDILKDEALSELSAVKNAQVFAMPADYEAWDSPVPSAFLGSLWIASVIHPDFFAQEDYEAALSAYYETFYGFSPANA